ncbi:G-type lectin S-receptor-like serine/threonine-protein kinase At1g11300 [Dioscorea cayenensis subsp. rotundata]|uniref:G-type lectin S-receptor-like serine/threonine-protein kinase At1g11300 n=1 Tax=Dioscorea cayennensis subsp. rotundata TaxID=55577 RepID=A0AB40CQQ3_DIOCR|nr:G-type lectin S-receptor-like serine/threonine-protein kinase At1g11300 [Dioscorea cayenensis subsp. rotundata]
MFTKSSIIIIIHSSSFLLLLILHTFLLKVSQGQNTLLLGESIKEGQSLVSSNRIYELGFFNSTNSTNSYVGIWYHQLPVKTIIWVANREKPVSDSSGVITIDTQGALVINDSKGTIFSSNTKGSNQTIAKLMNSGNFVLKASKYSQEFL